MEKTKYTPSQNIDPTKATFGEKSSGVLALQQALNAKGAGLKEDALYGPLTQAAFQKYNTPTSNTQTPIGQTFQIPTIDTQTQAEKDYLDIQNKLSRGEDIVDTNAIRSKTLSSFQDRINAINQVYAGKMAEAKQEGVGRVGSTTAILANRGLTGSMRGGTIAENTLTQNRQVENAIAAEQAAQINSIYGLVDEAVAQEATRRREAIQSGAKNYIEFIKGQDARKQGNISNIAGALISQGIDPNNMTPEELNGIANKIGTTSGDIITAYKTLKRIQDLEEQKIKKTSQPASVQEYEYAKANGYEGSYNDYQNLDANRKAKIAGAGSGGLTPYQQFSATQSIAKDNQKRTENAREMARQSQLINSSYNNIVNGGDRSLNTQAIITSFNKILDPTSVVRESEYDRTAAGQALISRLQGKYDNIVAGGAGVTEATLKEAADIAKTYLDQSRKYIEAENARAVSMANQFGLNPDFVTNTYQEDSGGDTGNQDPLGIFN